MLFNGQASIVTLQAQICTWLRNSGQDTLPASQISTLAVQAGDALNHPLLAHDLIAVLLSGPEGTVCPPTHTRTPTSTLCGLPTPNQKGPELSQSVVVLQSP